MFKLFDCSIFFAHFECVMHGFKQMCSMFGLKPFTSPFDRHNILVVSILKVECLESTIICIRNEKNVKSQNLIRRKNVGIGWVIQYSA